MQNSRSARVLHRFSDGYNLVNKRNEVVSLVSSRVAPGPFTITLEGDFIAGPEAQTPVVIDDAGHVLTVGPLIVDVGRAAVWDPKPDWARLRCVDVAGWPPPVELPDDISRYMEQTIDGIAAGDLPACLAGVFALAGRGSGLTPTGDDVLVGILYGMWLWRPRRVWMARIVETAAPRTTTLSANFLRAAADGEAAGPWYDLVAGHPGAVDRILAIGHTSGADAWAGFTRSSARFKEIRFC